MKTTWFLLDAAQPGDFLLYDDLPVPCILVKNGKVVYYNNSFQEFQGVDKQRLHIDIGEVLFSEDGSPFNLEDSCKSVEGWLRDNTGTDTAVLISAQCKSQKNDSANAVIILQKRQVVATAPDHKHHDAEKFFQSILDLNSNYYVCFDLEYNILYFNDIASDLHKEMNGVDLRIGLNLKEIYNKEAFEERKKSFYDPALQDIVHRKYNTKKGALRYIDISYQCLRDSRGNPIGIIEHGKEVTKFIDSIQQLKQDSQLVTEKVERQDSMLEAILDSSSDGLTAFDKDYNILMINSQARQEFKDYMGLDLKSGARMKELLSNEEIQRWDEVFGNRAFNGDSFESRVERDNGNRVYVNSYTPVRNINGEVVGALEVSREVTESVRVQEELRTSQVQLKSLIENSPVGIIRIGFDGRIKYISDKCAGYFGYSAEELLDAKATSLIQKEYLDNHFSYIERLTNGEEKLSFSFEAVHKEDRFVKLSGMASIIGKENDTQGMEFLLVLSDATDEFLAHAELKKVDMKFSYLFQNMSEAVFLYDYNQERFLEFNDATLNIFGYSAEELSSMTRFDIIPEKSHLLPDVDIQDRAKTINKVWKKGEIERINSAIVTKSGHHRLLRSSFVPVKDEPNIRFIISQDVTEEVEAKSELELRNAIYESLIRDNFNGVDLIEYDVEDKFLVNGRLMVRNQVMSKYFHDDKLYDSLDELITLAPDVQLDGRESEYIIKETIVNTIKNGHSMSVFRFDIGGEIYDVESYQVLIPIQDKVYMVRNYKDISSEVSQKQIIKAQMNDLNEKNEEMTKYIESNLQLENFAYIASHDLKAPIRSVISFAQLLRNNTSASLDPKNLKFLDIIIDASTNMQVLIDDLLSFSRVNTTEVQLEEIDVKEMIRRLLIELSKNIEDSQGEIIVGELPEKMIGDIIRIRQVFQNLIVNGLKFHKPDQTPIIHIDSWDRGNHFEFCVRDEGIGIEEKYLSEIFLMFKKLHSENKYKGTGIGLSIVKKIAEQHNGSIKAESKLGEGTSFYFTISKNLEANYSVFPD